jgi:hypothetical protein
MTEREQLARLQLMSLLRSGEYRAVSNEEKLRQAEDDEETVEHHYFARETDRSLDFKGLFG